MDLAALLGRCDANLAAGRINALDQALLRRWNAGLEYETDSCARRFWQAESREWIELVGRHGANQHYWHEFVQREMTLSELRQTLHEDPREPTPTFVDRALVSHYGFFCDTWHLAGSRFAAACLDRRRLACLDAGMKRLGLPEGRAAADAAILAPVANDAGIHMRIAQGVAAFLETTCDHLDFLGTRVITRRLAEFGNTPASIAIDH